MPDLSIDTLLRQPEFIARIRGIWERLPERLQRQHPHMGVYLRTADPSAYGDTALVRRDLERLIGNNIRMEELIDRAIRVTMAPSSEDDVFANISVSVNDVAGNELKVSLRGLVDHMPTVVERKHHHSSNDEGLNRYIHPKTGELIVVYNPGRDLKRGDEQEPTLLSGRLPMRHVFAALLPQTVFSDGDARVRLLSRVKVKNDQRFDPDEVYAGYAVRPLDGDRWQRLGHLAWLEGSAIRDRSRERVSVHDADGSITTFKLSFLENVLSGLRRIHYTLRGLSAVADLWDGLMVNMDTGEVALDPGARIFVLDGGLFADEDGVIHDHGVEDHFVVSSDEHVPGIGVRALAVSELEYTAEFLARKFGRIWEHYHYPKMGQAVRKMIYELGMAQAHLQIHRYQNASPAERAAFNDYLVEVIDRKIWSWTRAGTMASGRDGSEGLASHEKGSHASYNVMLHSYRMQVGMMVTPPEIVNDVVAQDAYEEAMSLIDESLHDDSQHEVWHDLFVSYYEQHGTNQLPMFFAKEVPLLMLKSEWHPDSGTFVDLVRERIAAFKPYNGEVLTWEGFGQEVRKLQGPDGGPDNNDGPSGPKPDKATVDEPGLAKVIQFPFGGSQDVISRAIRSTTARPAYPLIRSALNVVKGRG